MPDPFVEDLFAPAPIRDPQAVPSPPLPLAAQYGLSLLFVALATVLAFAVQHLIPAANLTLVYVVPVTVAATLFGWGPSLLAVVAGVAAFDFFFTEPYYSFAMTNPSDIWAAALLLIVATIVSSVAAEARRRALQANEAAERADALRALAHAVIESRPQREILQAAATALYRIFGAPAAVLLYGDGDGIDALAAAGGAQLTQADKDAARDALSSHLSMRGETYPHVQTYFDFWPISTPAGCNCVLGVDFAHSARERPPSPEKLVEVVGGYVAAALRPRSSSTP